LRNVLILLKKDVLRFLSDKPAVFLTFVLPAVLILIFGEIFGGLGEGQSRISVLLVNNSVSPIAKYFEEKLDSSEALKVIKTFTPEGSKIPQKLTETDARRIIKKGKVSTAIILPKDFLTDTSSSVHVKILYDPRNEIESSLIQGSIQRTLFSELSNVFPLLLQRKMTRKVNRQTEQKFYESLATTVSEAFGVKKDTVLAYLKNPQRNLSGFGRSGEGELFKGILNIENEQIVGQNFKNPQVTRSVGGWAVMFLLFSIVWASVTLFEEKQEGSLKRILCMPVTRSQILWSKFIYASLLGIVQLLLLFLCGWLFFHVDIFSNFGNLFVVIIVATMAAVSFGMLITSLAKSLNQANAVATILILIMSALGGSWFPVFLFPEWLQHLAKVTITYWAVDAFQLVLWRNADFSAIAVNVLILFSIGVIINFYAIARFRKGRIF